MSNWSCITHCASCFSIRRSLHNDSSSSNYIRFKDYCRTFSNAKRRTESRDQLNAFQHNKRAADYLTDITYANTARFIVPISYGKVIKVYDGDTITIASRLSNLENPIYRFSVRLHGIDSPEIKGQTFAEKELAIIARDALHTLIFGKIVTLRNVSTEKYGRVLADVYLDDLHINNWMLQEKYAVPYDGGLKIRPVEWG